MRELGQIAFDANAAQYDMPEAAQALYQGISEEADRIWWNEHQETRPEHAGEMGSIFWRCYDWASEPMNPNPNFVTPSLNIWWYKYPGRGMTCDKELNPDEWFAWFYETLAALKKIEKPLY